VTLPQMGVDVTPIELSASSWHRYRSIFNAHALASFGFCDWVSLRRSASRNACSAVTN